MSIESLFDNTCDIYHNTQTQVSPGFNLPASPKDGYPVTADLTDIPCHFNVRGDSPKLVQNEPQNSLTERTKLNLPIGTDVRINDKIVDKSSGLSYMAASPPRNIRNHHVIVYVERTRELKPL